MTHWRSGAAECETGRPTPGGQRLMDESGGTNDVTQTLPVFAPWRFGVRFSSSVDNHEPGPFGAAHSGQSPV
jgi:hypothetical protein